MTCFVFSRSRFPVGSSAKIIEGFLRKGRCYRKIGIIDLNNQYKMKFMDIPRYKCRSEATSVLIEDQLIIFGGIKN